jgi:hypothetical protein
MHHMTRKRGAILIKGFQPFHWEIAALRQNGVQSRARVPFAHDESIAIGPVRLAWIVTKRPSVNGGKQVRRGQRASDVRSVRLARHANAMLPDSLRKVRKIDLVFGTHGCCSALR